MLLNARQIRQASGKPRVILLAIEDITARKEAERTIEALLEGKNLILKEVHHRIKNSMNTIVGLLGLQAAMLEDPVAIEALKDTESRVSSMMVLYDKLYRSVDYTELSIKEYLPSLIEEILANFPNRRMVKVEGKIEDFVVAGKKLQSIGIIITELLTNIMKYAFVDRESGSISVSASLNDAVATIMVKDDGRGIPESISFENSTGFGLILVRTLTEQIGGTIRLDRREGTVFDLRFKV